MPLLLPIDSSSAPLLRGRCLCGGTRYVITRPVIGTSYCHCEDCRRASGAPVVAWTFFATPGIRFEGEEPRSMEWAGRERTFCGSCGTPLSFFDPDLPHQFEVTTASLDRPEEHPPDDHTWVADRLPWFETKDDLPRFEHLTEP